MLLANSLTLRRRGFVLVLVVVACFEPFVVFRAIEQKVHDLIGTQALSLAVSQIRRASVGGLRNRKRPDFRRAVVHRQSKNRPRLPTGAYRRVTQRLVVLIPHVRQHVLAHHVHQIQIMLLCKMLQPSDQRIPHPAPACWRSAQS